MRNPRLSQPQPQALERALKIFGGNVQRERTARRMSQEKLALLAHLNARTICKIEAGELNVRRTTIERIQRALSCPLIKLLESDRKEDRTLHPTLNTILKRLSSAM